MSSILSINKSGNLKRVDNSLVFEEVIDNKIIRKIKIPIIKISQIDIYSNLTINTDLLYFLSKNKIGLNFFNNFSMQHYGEFNMWNQKGSERLMIKQFDEFSNNRLFYIKKIYNGMIENLLFLLSKYQKRSDIGKDITNIIKNIKKIRVNEYNLTNYMTYEAAIWKEFYSSLEFIIQKNGFEFNVRSKRPPENKLNALISFINTKLYYTINSVIKSTKLDNRIGFIHSLTDNSRFSLTLDMSELFKPIYTYYFIINSINNKKINIKDFDGDILLSDDGLTKINKLYFEFLEETFFYKKLNRNISYKYLIKVECYKLIKSIYNDADYIPISFRDIL